MIIRKRLYAIKERLIYKDDYVTVKVLYDKFVEDMLVFRLRSITDVGGYVLLETSHTIPESSATSVENEVIDAYYFKDYTEFRSNFQWNKIKIGYRHIDLAYRLWCKNTSRMLVSPDSNTYCIDSNGLVLHIEFSSSLNNRISHALPQYNLTYIPSLINNIGDLI